MKRYASHKLWKGRQTGTSEQILIEMGESISLDIELYKEDIEGSRIHARMLHKIGILDDEELHLILDGLDQIYGEIENNEMDLIPELEDIHTHVESRLFDLVGDAAKKLHTARSRNDQVALDTHLYVRRMSGEIQKEIAILLEAFLKKAKESVDIIMPGYTHLQVAQPIRASHHLLAHFWAFERDLLRFDQAIEGASRIPLGSGAMAGVNYENDREFMREKLGFDGIYPNSMDAVASRDHILDFLHAISVTAAHASRLAEEIVLWSSVEFSFITLPDSLTTGSSIMPQKKNPDLAELVRGKTGRLYSYYFNMLTNLKGLPYAYNRDLQEDRFPLLEASREIIMSVKALSAMVRGLAFQEENTIKSLNEGFATATDLADALVQKKGLPFRTAHHLVGELVGFCLLQKSNLQTVSIEIRATVSEYFEDDDFYFSAVDLASSADKKISYGGTARFRQIEQLSLAETTLQSLQIRLN